MPNTGHDWDADFTTIDAAVVLTTAGTVEHTSAVQDNDIKSGCIISIDTDYSAHAKATGGLEVYIFRHIGGAVYEDFDSGGFKFEMPFDESGTRRRAFAVGAAMTNKFKVGLKWLNTTGSAVATTKTAIMQADVPLAS